MLVLLLALVLLGDDVLDEDLDSLPNYCALLHTLAHLARDEVHLVDHLLRVLLHLGDVFSLKADELPDLDRFFGQFCDDGRHVGGIVRQRGQYAQQALANLALASYDGLMGPHLLRQRLDSICLGA